MGRLTVYVVYNAYPARAKVHTWEKRVVCISWVFGCYKTMMQQVDGRCGFPWLLLAHSNL